MGALRPPRSVDPEMVRLVYAAHRATVRRIYVLAVLQILVVSAVIVAAVVWWMS
jgi:hypothetical protein